jgi:hypothetical protein
MESGLCPDVYTPYELERADEGALSKYAIVFVPDCPQLPVRAAEQLRTAAKRGAQVVFGGRPPRLDETGRPLEKPLAPNPDVVVSVAPDQPPIPCRDGQPGIATLVTSSGGTWPGVVAERHGRGEMVWTGRMDGRGALGPVRRMRVAGNTPPLFVPDGEWTWPRPEAHCLLVDTWATPALKKLGVRLDPPDPTLEMCVYRKGDEYRVVLIHVGPGMHRGGRIVIAGPGTGSSEVMADFDPRNASQKGVDSGGTSIELPVFNDCCLVRY